MTAFNAATVAEAVSLLVTRLTAQQRDMSLLTAALSERATSTDGSAATPSAATAAPSAAASASAEPAAADSLATAIAALSVAGTHSLAYVVDQLDMAARVVDTAATHVALSFSSKPTIVESNPLFAKLLAAASSLASLAAALQIHPECSRPVWNYAKVQVFACFDALVEFASSLPREPSSSRISAAVVFEACGKFASLPRSNADAIKRELKSTFDLVQDASVELKEAIAEQTATDRSNVGDADDDDLDDPFGLGDEDPWTAEQITLAQSMLELIQATKKRVVERNVAFLKASEDDPMFKVAAINATSEWVTQVSPAVDSLVTALYSPDHPEAIREAATALKALS
ncbi:hypothetical protein CAOG_00538 [Capsaspora owczarzaki ATCC 30864]|nr:hypothetical protein CAOG_00538 [Capsaspora owczarzaki ATCC 30864]|eukprot:XP_004365409.2 hypothetical protein CAOG_00538 [Capsaspora owczarzaki ATCC 30864]